MLFISLVLREREVTLTATGANEAAATSSGSCARDRSDCTSMIIVVGCV
jgi:hypothetical protein